VTKKGAESKAARDARRVATEEKRYLRSALLGVLGDLGTLVPKEVATEAARASSTVGEYVRSLASASEGMNGTEHQGSVDALGAISDLARLRMTPEESCIPFESPADILRWFALYLERTLDKPDLRMT
jgi:hypothetical protein